MVGNNFCGSKQEKPTSCVRVWCIKGWEFSLVPLSDSDANVYGICIFVSPLRKHIPLSSAREEFCFPDLGNKQCLLFEGTAATFDGVQPTGRCLNIRTSASAPICYPRKSCSPNKSWNSYGWLIMYAVRYKMASVLGALLRSSPPKEFWRATLRIFMC